MRFWLRNKHIWPYFDAIVAYSLFSRALACALVHKALISSPSLSQYFNRYRMGKLLKLAGAALFAVSLTSAAQQANSEYQDGFISDELFIYMHSGAGNNYRIVGSINAGSQVKLTGEKNNGYTQIIDEKDRTAWVEDKYVSTKPGLRHVVAELNGQLASTGEQESQLKAQIASNKKQLSAIQSENTELTSKIASLESELASAQSKLETQDLDVMKEWFFNGGIVAGLGLLAGLFIPQLFGRKKSSMDSWK